MLTPTTIRPAPPPAPILQPAQAPQLAGTQPVATQPSVMQPVATQPAQTSQPAPQENPSSDLTELQKKFPKALKLQEAELGAIEAFEGALKGQEWNKASLSWPEVPAATRTWLFNLRSNGIFEFGIDDATGAPKEIKLTERGFQSLQAKMVRDRPGRKPGVAVSTDKAPHEHYIFNPDFKIRIMVKDNPYREGSNTYFNWKLYKGDATLNEYLKVEAPKGQLTKKGKEFTGPTVNQFLWDLAKGYLALYNSKQSETLENGIRNPDFWVVKNMLDPAIPAAEHNQPVEKAA